VAKTFTLQDFNRSFPDDAACLDHLMQLRYGERLECPKCHKTGRFTRLAKTPAYACPWCGHHIHPMVGTPFAKTHVPLVKWFYAIYLFTTTRHGVPAKELERQLGVSYPTAFRMAHEIRKFMAFVDGDNGLSGHIEIDETHIGGRNKGRGHQHRMDNKTTVFGMLERDGAVMTQIVANTRKTTLERIIANNVKTGSEVSTDEHYAYADLRFMGYKHEAVNHHEEEYVRGKTHTNSIEGFWSMLKRSIRGTHVHVSRKHLSKYLGEFEFRYNLRHSPHLMFLKLMASF
jgi:transposase